MKLFRKMYLPTVILSGPTSGLGLALLEQLNVHDVPTVGLGRNLARFAATESSLSSKVKLIEVDLGASSDVLTNALVPLSQYVNSNPIGPLVFVSNASTIEPIGRSITLEYSSLEGVMRVNCLAPLMIANILTKVTQGQDRPLLILNITSGAASRPIGGWQAYCISKAACKMGFDVLAEENTKVKVIHFDPGVVNTSMQELIRSHDAIDMPDVETFRSYHTKNLLKTPKVVACELLMEIHSFLCSL